MTAATRSRLRTWPIWIAVVAAVVAGGWAGGRIGMPSGFLFAALLTGLAVALLAPGALRLRRGAFTAGQAVTGVVLGTYLQASTLGAVGEAWLPVLLVSLATLALTVLAGLAVARATGLDAGTASLGMIAGGASGIVAMSDELGADDRLVAFMQYLRVLIIVVLTPVLVGVAFPGAAGGADPTVSGPLLGDAGGWAFALAVAAVGALAGRRLHIPAGTLLLPLGLAAALTLTGVAGDAQVPPLLRETGFALIGLQVGLRFTPDTLRLAGRILPSVVGSILAMVAACFGLGWVLSETAGVSLLEGYLATTPGGLYAVLATAFGADADTTFVLAVQVVRLLVMILAAPPLVRVLVGRAARPG